MGDTSVGEEPREDGEAVGGWGAADEFFEEVGDAFGPGIGQRASGAVAGNGGQHQADVLGVRVVVFQVVRQLVPGESLFPDDALFDGGEGIGDRGQPQAVAGEEVDVYPAIDHI